MKKKTLIMVIFLLVIILSKFWIGIYEHDEFYEHDIFLKHRPVWKTYFYSPRGMSDLKLSEMTPEEQKEQALFDEFVLNSLFFTDKKRMP